MPASRRLPPLRALEAFVRIVRLGSARAAAAELALSASALSRRVGGLEDFVGKKLFTRHHQAMRLTEDGQAFYDAVAPRLDELALAVEAQVESSQLWRLHLGVPLLFATQRLFPRLPALRALHPRLHIDIDTAAHPELRVGESLDAAIILSPEPDTGFHAVRLDHNRVHAVASVALAAALGPRPDRAKLEQQTFILHSEYLKSFDNWKAAIGIPDLQPASIDQLDSGQLTLEAAAQGLGIAIMHDDHRRRAADKRLRVIYDTVVESPYSYWFVCRPRGLEQRPVRLFLEWLLKAKI